MNRRQLLKTIPSVAALAAVVGAQEKKSSKQKYQYIADPKYFHPPFKNVNPNQSISSFTKLDRDGWIACGKHILEGAFKYVKSFDDPMLLPKFPGPGYPANGNDKANQQQRSAAIFEAIARTFNIAAPLIKNDPDITIGNIKLVDYYKHHLLRLVTDEKCPYFIGKASHYNRPVQQTCELGNLAMWNIIAPESFWSHLSKAEKDKLAIALKEWSETNTNSHNWRWFNVMMATFLDIHGYPCSQSLIENYIDDLLLHHAGDGWYRDTSYDYYTAHVFQLYGSVWSKHYGRKHQPQRAKLIDQFHQEFTKNYQQIFGRNGEVNMYGRSILYRLGASAGMSAVAHSDSPSESISMGLARRVSSGALLQFVTHPDFFYQGIPAMGFYGPFPKAIQNYSCSASPYWMFLSFSCLTLSSDHEFWTAKEEAGIWEGVKPNQSHTEYWSGPGMLVSMHGTSGASELRPSKVHSSNPNYSKLVYNTAFPWEATPSDYITSSAFSLRRGKGKRTLPESVSSAGCRKGVLYRQAHFPGHLAPFVDMASIVIPGGEIRIDRLRRLIPCNVTLGHFSIPHLKSEPKKLDKKVEGKQSVSLAIPGRQLAMTNYQGWGEIVTRFSSDIHPEAKQSTLVYAERSDGNSYGAGPTLLISILLHKTDDTAWTDDELQPIVTVVSLEPNGIMHLTGLKITLKSGAVHEVDFNDIDGTNSTF
jgi:hypothetical protein